MTIGRVHAMPFGAAFCGGSTRFRLWAPAAARVSLVLDEARESPMAEAGGGWFEATSGDAPAGARYRFRIDGRTLVPDPASRYQSDGVDGPSEVIDPASYAWHDVDWRGRPWEEAVAYELHVGAFTAEGSFAAVESRLDHLCALGVTALELMPVACFAGRRNWGYDGVLPFAPHASYGRPESLKSLVDAAHRRGLMVLLDVVYNHFGPAGNRLPLYAPQFFTERARTPWGEAIDFEGPESRVVRDFFIHNALYWLEEFHLDGLRLDAVHAIVDSTSPDIADEIARAVREGPGARRHVHLVVENDRNEVRRLARESGRCAGHTAQWNDDLHHAMHVLLTRERSGYYVDYADEPARKLARALAEGFVYQGESSRHRGGVPRGEPSAGLPPVAFVSFLQNHDQIGNRAFGERITRLATEGARACALATLALAPSPPLFFMGEEWDSQQPFPFFCDFGVELGRRVTEGRREEFGSLDAFRDPRERARIPDPNAPATFESAVLDWREPALPRGAAAIARLRALLQLRAAEVVPRLAGMAGDSGSFALLGGRAFVVRWRLGDGTRLFLIANFGDRDHGGEAVRAARDEVAACSARAIHSTPPSAQLRLATQGVLAAWSACWFVDAGADAGASADANAPALRRLAALCGILAGYRDVAGGTHTTSVPAMRQLLAAMGVDCSSNDAVSAAIEARERAPFLRRLPPVVVIASHEVPATIPVSLPAARAGEPLSWRLVLESGETRAGETVPAALAVVDERLIGGERYERRAFELAGPLPDGYHRFELAGAAATTSVIVATGRCFVPEALQDDRRAWGVTVQLYALESERNWGIGDFTDLADVMAAAAAGGASALGVSPLHALFAAVPEQASPYSPSSRAYVNPLYLDIEAIDDVRESPEAMALVRSAGFQERLRALRAAPLVDYGGVKAAKFELLERAWEGFAKRHVATGSERGRAFDAWRREAGPGLSALALFDALHETVAARARDASREREAGVPGWPGWPEGWRDPESPEVAAFARHNADRVGFFEYVQWQALLQLEAVARRAVESGLAVGLYQDLALGVDGASAETWANRRLYALGASSGAPPDDFNPRGQNWGLPPLLPAALVDAAYQPFIDLLRANMRRAGALRIDHVMALMRLYWLPAGASAADGAYVGYPLDDLAAIVALESARNRCVVIGEDLGTVPGEVREALSRAGVLSYRVLMFERDAQGGFAAPPAWPAQALAAVSTHDLPTLAGFWRGRDIEVRSALRLFPDDSVRERAMVDRAADRARLWLALEREQLLPEAAPPTPLAVPDLPADIALAIHVYVARTASKLMMVQPEDVLGVVEQANLPGSVGEHPNWRRKLALPVAQWAREPRLRALAEALRPLRGARPTADSRGRAAPPTRIPRATYRIQLHRGFTFANATAIVDYLAELGVSDAYFSPFLKARPGSTHGYDVVDHDALNPELGGEAAYDELCESLRQRGLGQLIDVVPNHMAVHGSDNAWWLDVLENGQASAYAGFFDIDWQPLREELRDKLLLPVLGDHFGAVLERGELVPCFDPQRGALSIRYFDHRFPVDPQSYPAVLGEGLEALARAMGESDAAWLEFQALLGAFGRLPPHRSSAARDVVERSRDKEVHKRRLAALVAEHRAIADHVDAAVASLAGVAGVAASFDRLAALLDVQPWRVANWRVAFDEINYRRFFDINDLAGVRVEDERVFDATHRRVLSLVAQGRVSGLRIDHPDGLHDPRAYFRRLVERAGAALGRIGTARPLYLVIEKIRADYERLCEDWPVHGTTGYAFARLATGLFVDATARGRFDRLYRGFVDGVDDFGDVVHDSKRTVMRAALAGELGVLATLLSRIAAADRHTRDFTVNSLRDALAEVVACFPVYRTYVSVDGASAEDRRFIAWAVAVARRRMPVADATLFDFVERALTTDIAKDKPQAYREQVFAFAMKFQQLTAPVTAKGVEDTAFYRYNRLLALNEVGGGPEPFGHGVHAFHAASADRARRWPHTMLATSTHDTKRSEDVRARLAVLSEIPAAWRLALRRWRRLNRRHKGSIDGRPAPSPNDEYLLYQSVIGAWPLEALGAGSLDHGAMAALRERIERYMLKAMREAKVETSWLDPHVEYERATLEFATAVLSPGPRNLFLREVAAFVARIAHAGLVNGLAQTLIKLASPGVPDIYQGNEIWDFSLVDPDNRRPVDFDRRRSALRSLVAAHGDGSAAPGLAGEIAGTIDDGRAKLYLVWRALALRRSMQPVFTGGEYLPLAVAGRHADHLVAFARRAGEGAALAVVPRLALKLTGEPWRLPVGEEIWGDTSVRLPAELGELEWTDELAGGTHRAAIDDAGSFLGAAALLSGFPVALLSNRRPA